WHVMPPPSSLYRDAQRSLDCADSSPCPPIMPRPVRPSRRLDLVTYDIRGPLSRRARELEAEGRQILRLNIGNPGAFGFRVPDVLREAVQRGVADSEAYCHQQGLPTARAAIAERERGRGAQSVSAETVFIGNGVS